MALVALTIAGIGASGWWWFQQQTALEEQPEMESFTSTITAPPPDQVLDEPPETIDPEALESAQDTISPDMPEMVTNWLNAPSFLQRLVAAIWRVSRGRSPTKVLGFVELNDPFTVTRRGKSLYVDRSSFDRYTPIVDSILAVSPTTAAELYQTLLPQLRARFAQLAADGERFEEVARRAIRSIMTARIPKRPTKVIEVGGTYYYADDGIQALSDVDKHLIRIGPNNLKRLRKWLHAFSKHANLR